LLKVAQKADLAVSQAHAAIRDEVEIQAGISQAKAAEEIRGRIKGFLERAGKTPFELWDLLALASTKEQRSGIAAKYRTDQYVIQLLENGNALIVADKPGYLAEQAAIRAKERRDHESAVRARLEAAQKGK
jgi:hypothetical protein